MSSTLNASSASPRSVLASRSRAAVTIALVLQIPASVLFLRDCSEPLRCASLEPGTRLSQPGGDPRPRHDQPPRHAPAAGDTLIFWNETIWSRNAGRASGEHLSLGRGQRETQLTEQRSAIAQSLVNALRGCRVFHFHDTSRQAPVKQQGFIADNQALHPDAGNLAAVLLRMRQRDPNYYQRIVNTIRQVAPFFRDFVLEPELAEDRLRLRWRQEGSDTVFPADAMSDGTLRFICLTVLLNQPELPGLVVLDEPELGLHPFAIVQLAEMLRVASYDSQVILATQSVTLMNQIELDDLIVVERRNRASVFERPDPQRLSEWLAEYSLGDLWEKTYSVGAQRRSVASSAASAHPSRGADRGNSRERSDHAVPLQ
jgi:putative AbiEii toxin of type IV toxin-antitoxin system